MAQCLFIKVQEMPCSICENRWNKQEYTEEGVMMNWYLAIFS